MIKDLTINDRDSFNRLGSVLKVNFSNLYVLEDILKSSYDYVYGYYLDDALVGFVHVTKSFENLDIVNIVVDSSYKRKGIGTKLFNFILSAFNDLECIFLEVRKDNIEAISFYEKMNFEVLNIRKNYYGDCDAICMKRDV